MEVLAGGVREVKECVFIYWLGEVMTGRDGTRMKQCTIGLHDRAGRDIQSIGRRGREEEEEEEERASLPSRPG